MYLIEITFIPGATLPHGKAKSEQISKGIEQILTETNNRPDQILRGKATKLQP
jgi:hypothetical protein